MSSATPASPGRGPQRPVVLPSPFPLPGMISPCRISARYTADRPGSGAMPARSSSPGSATAPPQMIRYRPTIRASIPAGIWCGHEAGRYDRSASPDRPPLAPRQKRDRQRHPSQHPWRPGKHQVTTEGAATPAGDHQYRAGHPRRRGHPGCSSRSSGCQSLGPPSTRASAWACPSSPP
jgi:hypothetical protein